MEEGRKKDILFYVYILAVVCLAVIYFTVPERKEFIDLQVKWWKEFLN